MASEFDTDDEALGNIHFAKGLYFVELPGREPVTLHDWSRLAAYLEPHLVGSEALLDIRRELDEFGFCRFPVFGNQ
jgi:hypothetical protein